MGRTQHRDSRPRLTIRDYPSWLVAIATLALLGVPWLIGFAAAPRHHLDAPTVGILAAVSLPLAAVWLAWATFAKGEGSATSVSSPSLAKVADQLAAAVGKQWADEAAIRRLNDPYPLPVSWVAADAALTDSWDSLVRLATSGAGWPHAPRRETWAARPDDLAGEGDELADALARVPTGRLVVLGEPGAGKTMLMVRLVLDLLAGRTSGEPVPILAAIASWNPSDQNLRDWLCAQLIIDYPSLANVDEQGITQAAALLAAGSLLLVLDGLDEIPKEVRGSAITKINEALRPGERLVVTCRTQQYCDAVRPPDGIEVTLRAAAAVQLGSLDSDAIRDYLLDDAAGPVAKARWNPVFKALGTHAPVAQALETPLMVGLARAIYNPRPGEQAGALGDPAELCDPALADRGAVESRLFDAFIPAVYRGLNAQEAEKRFIFLARHLERNIVGPDLAWWELPRAVQSWWLGFLNGIILGLIVWSICYGLGTDIPIIHGLTVIVGPVAAVASGIPIAISVSRRSKHLGPSHGIQWRPPGRFTAITAALSALACFLVAVSKLGLGAGCAAGVATGLTVGCVSWALDQQSVRQDISSVASPMTAFLRDRKTAFFGIFIGAAIWAVFTLQSVVLSRLSDGQWTQRELLGAELGVSISILYFSYLTAWSAYQMARIWLAFRRRLPWSLMSFLVDAHRRGVLRQVGAVYQFRHIELQRRLANRGSG